MSDILERQPGESVLEYHRRLVYGKLVDHTLSHLDYSELSKYVYGTQYSSDHARKAMYGSCRTLQILDGEKQKSSEASDQCEEIDRKIMTLQKEQQKFYDQRNEYKKLLRHRSRQEEVNDLISSVIENASLPSLPHGEGFSYGERHPDGDNDLIVCLSDIHYGIETRNAWNAYNPDLCAKMMQAYAAQILSIAQTHRSKDCYIAGLGDFISGSIHVPIALSNKENVVRQVMGVSELISEFVATLSAFFEHVYFISVAGNHSRIGPKEDVPLDERLDDLISFYMKARLRGLDNVLIESEAGEKIDSTMFGVYVRDRYYMGVHGDFDGTPAGIHSLITMAQKPVYGVLCGHKHHSYSESVQGVQVVMSGSFVAVDDYSVSRRLYSRPEQTVCICDTGGIRCIYNVPLTIDC